MFRPLALKIVTDVGGITVFASGDVDLSARPTVDYLIDELGSATRNVLIDLHDVTYMDSTGLALLMDVHNRCNRNGATLTVRSLPPIVRHLVELTGLDRVLRITDPEGSRPDPY